MGNEPSATDRSIDDCQIDDKMNREKLAEAWKMWTNYLEPEPEPDMLFSYTIPLVRNSTIWLISVDGKPVGYAKDLQAARTRMHEMASAILWDRTIDNIGWVEPPYGNEDAFANELLVIKQTTSFFFFIHFPVLAKLRIDAVSELA